MNEELQNLAEKLLAVYKKATTFNVGNSELAEKLALESGKVALFSNRGRFDYEGPLVEKNLANFIYKHSMPLLTEFNDETTAQLFEHNTNLKHAIVFISRDSEDFEEVIEDAKKAAEKMKGSELVFSFADVNSEKVRGYANHFKLDVDQTPSFRVFRL